MIPWKGIGIAVGAAVSVVSASVSVLNARAHEPASAIEQVHQELVELRKETTSRLDTMNERLSTLAGYIAGREKTK